MPHTSFLHPDNAKSPFPRESIEGRAMVFFDDDNEVDAEGSWGPQSSSQYGDSINILTKKCVVWILLGRRLSYKFVDGSLSALAFHPLFTIDFQRKVWIANNNQNWKSHEKPTTSYQWPKFLLCVGFAACDSASKTQKSVTNQALFEMDPRTLFICYSNTSCVVLDSTVHLSSTS